MHLNVVPTDLKHGKSLNNQILYAPRSIKASRCFFDGKYIKLNDESALRCICHTLK